jgi:large subunit ribosomal protein L21
MSEQKTYAIIKAGGGQVRVVEGETLRVARAEGSEPGVELVFPSVLLLARDGKVEIGRPFIEGARVVTTVLGHGRGKKIRIYTFKSKKGYQRTKGHRQDFTTVKVKSIVGG